MIRFRHYGSIERDAEAAKARRRRVKLEEQQHEERRPNRDNPIACAAHEAGGHLIQVKLSIPEGQNGGCGGLIHVIGTNGGTIPCGSYLTQFGERLPYYCDHCDIA